MSPGERERLAAMGRLLVSTGHLTPQGQRKLDLLGQELAGPPRRILVTGSRDWADAVAVRAALARHVQPGDVVVHGACPTGADAIAEAWAREHNVTVETHPARWDEHGRRAGYLRNRTMIDAGADVCLAFSRDDSRGTAMTVKMATQAGIEVVIHRERSQS